MESAPTQRGYLFKRCELVLCICSISGSMIKAICTVTSSFSKLRRTKSKVNVPLELKQFYSYSYVVINQTVPLLPRRAGQVVIHLYFCACVTVFSQGRFCCETDTEVTLIMLQCDLCMAVLQTVSFGRFPNDNRSICRQLSINIVPGVRTTRRMTTKIILLIVPRQTNNISNWLSQIESSKIHNIYINIWND